MLGEMQIQSDLYGLYYVKIGARKRLDGTIGPYRFQLTKDFKVSKERAERLWKLWLEQNGEWTQEGLKKGRELARGWDQLVFPFLETDQISRNETHRRIS